MADILISQLPAASPLLTDLMIVANPTTGIAKKSTVTQLNNVLTLAGLSDVQQGTPPANSILEWDGGFSYNTNILRNDGLNLNYIPLVSATSPYALANSQLYNGAYGVEISEDTYLNNASVLFGLSSNTKGFLKPRMTTTEKNAITSPIKGLEVFDNVLNMPYFYNGTAWKGVQELLVSATNIKTINGTSLLGSGNIAINGGITTLNTLTATTQTFATSTTGTDFTISSATSTHTFNFPSSSASARGLLTSADFIIFYNKIGGSGTANYLAKFTASGTIGNSLIYDNGSGVGIGTSSADFATYKLVVAGNANITGYINTNTLFATTTATNEIKPQYPNPTITLMSASGTRSLTMYENSGDIYIGINPLQNGYKLTVSGTSLFTDTLLINKTTDAIFRLRGGTYSGQYDTTIRAMSGAQGILQLGNNDINYIIAGNNSAGGYLVFRINATGENITSGTEAMRIATNGNVGIGTTTPSEKLHVNGNILGSYIIANNELYGVNLRVNGIYPNSLTYLPFYSSASPYNELMRLDNSGALLIGLTSPSTYKLDLVGSQRIVSSSFVPFTVQGGTNSYIEVFQTGFSCTVYLGVLNTSGNFGRVGTVTNFDFAVMTNNTEAARFTNSTRNLLINTQTDVSSSKLTIESTTQGILIPRMTTTQIKNITSPVKGLLAFSNDDNVLAFYDGTGWKKVNHATL